MICIGQLKTMTRESWESYWEDLGKQNSGNCGIWNEKWFRGGWEERSKGETNRRLSLASLGNSEDRYRRISKKAGFQM
jgi:hypothetical protein